MRALFIWTIIYPVQARPLDDGARMPAERDHGGAVGVSRELVEIRWSGLCNGTAVRFLQPHSADRLRLHVARNEITPPGMPPLGWADDLTLGVTLLSVTPCADGRCCANDAPCISAAVSGQPRNSFLICPDPDDCHALEGTVIDQETGQLLPAAPNEAVPGFIQRLVALSLSAVPPSGQCSQCRTGRWQRLAAARQPPGRVHVNGSSYRAGH